MVGNPCPMKCDRSGCKQDQDLVEMSGSGVMSGGGSTFDDQA